MTSDETTVPPALSTLAAPARAVRLMPKPVTPVGSPAAATAAEGQTPVFDPLKASPLERKLSGLNDAQAMLHVMSTELALQRAARLHGGDGKSRQAMRVLSITVLFALLIAALAAMSWMQSRLAQKGFSRHRTEATSQK